MNLADRSEPLIYAALEEDLASAGDITSDSCVSEFAHSRAHLVARAPGVVAGLGIFSRVFEIVDEEVEIDLKVSEGDRVSPGMVLAVVEGSSRSLLAAERTALNILSHMSGVATATATLVDLVKGTEADIADTRKTLPNLRALEKYAVKTGGGRNHRFGLYDAVMVKDNHIIAAGGIREAVLSVRSEVGHTVRIEVEADCLEAVQEVLEIAFDEDSRVDVVLLDNMSPEEMSEAVKMIGGRLVTEASGGITPETVRKIAETGVDIISTGWITHSAPGLDIALDFV